MEGQSIIDGNLWKMVLFVSHLGEYFYTVVNVIAMICMALMLGTGAIQLMLGVMDVRKFMIKSLITTVNYFVFIHVFPIMMSIINIVLGSMATGAVAEANMHVGSSYSDRTPARMQEFKTWINSIVTHTTLEGGEVLNEKETWNFGDDVLNIDIRGAGGYLSLDKMFLFMTRVFTVIFKQASMDGFKFIAYMFLILIIGFFFIFAVGKLMVEYIGTVIQYEFIRSVGVLLIPLMLWEKTRMGFDKLIGTIFKVSIRFLIIQICVYFAMYITTDILWNVFIWNHKGAPELPGRLEFYISFAINTMFILWLANEAPGMADFISGEYPGMGIHGFMQTMTQAVAGAAMGGKAAGMAAGAVRGAGRIGSQLWGMGTGAAKIQYEGAQREQIKNYTEGKNKQRKDNGLYATDSSGNVLNFKGSDGKMDQNIRDNKQSGKRITNNPTAYNQKIEDKKTDDRNKEARKAVNKDNKNSSKSPLRHAVGSFIRGYGSTQIRQLKNGVAGKINNVIDKGMNLNTKQIMEQGFYAENRDLQKTQYGKKHDININQGAQDLMDEKDK